MIIIPVVTLTDQWLLLTLSSDPHNSLWNRPNKDHSWIIHAACHKVVKHPGCRLRLPDCIYSLMVGPWTVTYSLHTLVLSACEMLGQHPQPNHHHNKSTRHWIIPGLIIPGRDLCTLSGLLGTLPPLLSGLISHSSGQGTVRNLILQLFFALGSMHKAQWTASDSAQRRRVSR